MFEVCASAKEPTSRFNPTLRHRSSRRAAGPHSFIQTMQVPYLSYSRRSPYDLSGEVKPPTGRQKFAGLCYEPFIQFRASVIHLESDRAFCLFGPLPGKAGCSFSFNVQMVWYGRVCAGFQIGIRGDPFHGGCRLIALRNLLGLE